MRAFLLISAVLVGLANAGLYSLISDNSLSDFFVPRPVPWPLLLVYALCGAYVGVMAAAVLLRFAEKDLKGTFFARYGLMVLTVCAGGAVLAVFLTTAAYLLDPGVYKPRTTTEFVSGVAFSALPGGVLGAAQGVVLAFPLAWLLGMFRDRERRKA